jgi:G3E family GTPase
VEAFLNEIHEVIPGSCIVPTVRCNVDPEIIWARVEGNPTRMGKGDFSNQPKINKEYGQSDHENSCGEYHHQHADSRERGFVAFSFVHDTPLDELLFKHFLEELPWELFRVKGSVQFPDRTALLNHAGRISEWSLWINKPNTRLVFVGWKVDPEKIIRKLKECVLPNCSP